MSNKPFQLGETTCVIGEIAQAHDGSLGMAHAYIDAIADSGADAVKFQTHIASAESTPHEQWRVKFSQQDASRFDYWKRMEFSQQQWQELARHARDRNLLFMSSPFSIEAVELLEKTQIDAWKIASGEVTNQPIVERTAGSGQPVLLSTGLNFLSEVDQAVDLLRKHNADFAVLQCTSVYPTPYEQVGLNMITSLQKRYGAPVGLSDHTGTIYPCLAAAALGATLFEVHVTFDRNMFGPDVSSSVTFAELSELVNGVRAIEQMLNNPVDKDEVATVMEPMRKLFQKSIVTARQLPEGHVLDEKDIALKKPGGGLPASKVPDILGKKLVRSLDADSLLQDTDLE